MRPNKGEADNYLQHGTATSPLLLVFNMQAQPTA